MIFDVLHGVTDGAEVLGLLVGDLDAELLLAGVDDLDHGQGVDVEIVGEGLLLGHLGLLDTGDVVDDVCEIGQNLGFVCLLYTSPSPRDATLSRMPSSA